MSERKRLSYLLFSIFAGLLLAGMIAVGAAFQAEAGEAQLWLDPAVTTLGPGERTSIVIRMDNITNVYGVEVHLGFDAGILQVVDALTATPGVEISPGACPQPDFVILNTTDNLSGTIDYAATQLNPTPACAGGGVAVITVQCVGLGDAALFFDAATIADPDGMPITHTTQNTALTCGPSTSTPTPTVLPGAYLPVIIR